MQYAPRLCRHCNSLDIRNQYQPYADVDPYVYYCYDCYTDYKKIEKYNHEKYDLGYDMPEFVENSRNTYYPVRFVTFTLDKDHKDTPHEACMKKIRSLAASKSVHISAYFGSLELTERGIKHYHVIFHIKPSVGASKRGFNKSHIGNFWKYGNVDVQNVQVPLSSNIIKVLNYITKEGDENNFFGNKKYFTCLANDTLAPGVDTDDQPLDVKNQL